MGTTGPPCSSRSAPAPCDRRGSGPALPQSPPAVPSQQCCGGSEPKKPVFGTPILVGVTLFSPFSRTSLHRFPSGEHHGQHLPGCALHLPGRGVPREPHLPVVLGGGECLLQEVSLYLAGWNVLLIFLPECAGAGIALRSPHDPPLFLSQRPEVAGADPDRRDADHIPRQARGCWKIHLHPQQQPGPLAVRLCLPDSAV